MGFYVSILIASVSAFLITPTSLRAQAREAAPTLRYEVASVKPSPPDARPGFSGCHGTDVEPMTMVVAVPLGRCVFRHIDFRRLVLQAYPDLSPSFRTVVGIDEQVKGGPGWIGSSFFDVEGEAANPATMTTAQLQEMLRALLKDRFQFSFHMETKEMSAYVMMPSKDGLRVKNPPVRQHPRRPAADPHAPCSRRT